MDAHFDLRNPLAGGSSGTPFRQIAEWCEQHNSEFRYLVLGINPAANTEALFDYARAQGVQWVEDWACSEARLPALQDTINEFVAPLDALYLTLCLDVFAAALTPGVSAPGVPGISATTGIALLHHIRTACAAHKTRLLLMDIAEMNPHFDRDGITARWAARLIREYLA
jgi:formiminoglutamase